MLLLQYLQCHREEDLDIVERKGISLIFLRLMGMLIFVIKHIIPRKILKDWYPISKSPSLSNLLQLRNALEGISVAGGGGIYPNADHTSGTVPPLGPVERKTSLTAACLEYCMVFGVFVFCGDGTQSNSISQMNTLYWDTMDIRSLMGPTQRGFYHTRVTKNIFVVPALTSTRSS